MPAIEQEQVKLRGELVSFRSFTADGWGVGQVQPATPDGQKRRPAPVSITGKLLGVFPGDRIEVEGVWVTHEKYGRQLKVKQSTTLRPEGADGVVKWIASRLPDVGERRARELVARFGEQLWDVVEHHTARLCEVKGITPARAEAIRDAYLLVAAEREHMVMLRGWGLTDSQVGNCLAAWKTLPKVVDRLRENPYQLSQVVYGFGFVRADQVARAMEIPLTSPFRIQAGVEHVLSESEQAGHCYVAGAALRDMAADLLKVDPALVPAAILAVVAAGRAVRRGWRVYSSRMDVAEEDCAVSLRALLERGKAA